MRIPRSHAILHSNATYCNSTPSLDAHRTVGFFRLPWGMCRRHGQWPRSQRSSAPLGSVNSDHSISIKTNHHRIDAHGMISILPVRNPPPVDLDARAAQDPDHLAWLSALPQDLSHRTSLCFFRSLRMKTNTLHSRIRPATAPGLHRQSLSSGHKRNSSHQGGFSYQDAQLEVRQIRPRPNEPFAKRCAFELPPPLPPRRSSALLNPGSIGPHLVTAIPRGGFLPSADPRSTRSSSFWRRPYDISARQIACVPYPFEASVPTLIVGR